MFAGIFLCHERKLVIFEIDKLAKFMIIVFLVSFDDMIVRCKKSNQSYSDLHRKAANFSCIEVVHAKKRSTSSHAETTEWI